MRKTLLVLLALLLAACGPAAGLTVSEPWSHPGLAGGNGGVFFVIENPGDADTLLSAASDAAGAVELHRTVMDGDVMHMQPQPSIAVPAGGDLAFEPGGLHVMLIGLQSDLVAGESFELELNFEKAGRIVLQVEVRQP
jgi:copper(I)-binding protein